jgi:hypothetical protein
MKSIFSGVDVAQKAVLNIQSSDNYDVLRFLFLV